MTQEAQPTRLPFHVEFFETANSFSTAVLAKIPELQGVAVVPLWSPVPEDVPVGVLRVRSDGEMIIPQLFKMMGQMSSFNLELHQKLADQLGIIDKYAHKLTEEIKKLHDEYDKIKPQEAQSVSEQKQ